MEKLVENMEYIFFTGGFILEKIDLEFPPSTHTLDYVVVKRIRMQPYAVGLWIIIKHIILKIYLIVISYHAFIIHLFSKKILSNAMHS